MNDQTLSDINTFFDNPRIQDALSSLGFFAVDYVNTRAFASSVWLKWGYDASQILNPILPEILHPDDREQVLHHIEALKTGKEDRYSGVFRVTCADNSLAWVAATYLVLYRTDEGTPLLFLGHDQDVTEIKRNEEEKARQVEEIETLRQVISDFNASLDLHETVSSILSHTRRVIPYDKASVQLLEGSRLKVIGCYGFSDRESTLQLEFDYPVKGSPSTIAIQSREPVVRNDVERDFVDFVSVPGEETIRAWLGIPLIGNNEVIGLMALDSTTKGFYTERHLEMAKTFAGHIAMAMEKARLYENAQAMALTDNLTGTGNRHSLHMQGNFFLEKAKRDKSRLTALMFDLDFFKLVNDEFGHDVGDTVLRETASIIKQGLRQYDLLFRYGGEEFLVLLVDSESENAESIAGRIRAAVEAHQYTGLLRPQTISIGIGSAVPSSSMALSDLVKLADTALYHAKHLGRNRVVVNTLN